MSDDLITALGLMIVYTIAVGLGWLTTRVEHSDVTRRWIAAIAFLAFDEAAASIRIVQGRVYPWILLSWGALFGAVFFALKGTFSMVGKSDSRWPLACLSGAALAVMLGGLFELDLALLTAVVFECLAMALLWGSYIIFKHVRPTGLGRGVAASAFACAGIYAATWPVLDRTHLGRRLEFFLDLSVVLGAATGAYFLHFERARERIRQLAQQEIELRAQLEQSERLEALGRLAGGVAHDFNNVLTTVIHGSELVLKQIEDRPRAAEHLRLVLESAQGATQITRQLLSLGRRRLPGRRWTSVKEALSAAFGMIRPNLTHQVKFVSTQPDEDVEVLAGQGQLEQIVVNLAINALDAMPEGGTLELVSSVDATTTRLTMTVRDTGCGMEEEVQTHVFEPFFSTKSESRTGLGLAAVYAIVKQLDGNISVTSSVGEGTVFTVKLPCRTRSEPSHSRPPSLAPTQVGSVLVVDDQAAVLAAVSASLTEEGFAVQSARGAAEALALAEQDPPSILLTDLRMPEVDGLELLRQLRSRFPRLPAVLMTAHFNEAEMESGRFDVHWLTKPFTRQQLRAAIDAAIEHGRTAYTNPRS